MRSLHRLILTREIESLRQDDQLLSAWWWGSEKVIAAASSAGSGETPQTIDTGIFYIQLSYLIAPTQARCIATDFLQLCKSFSYLKYVQSTFLCDHSCICRNRFYWPYRCPIYVQVGQLCCGNSLRASLEGQSHYLGCYWAHQGRAAVSISWPMCSSSCPGGICRAVRNSPWRAADEIGQTLQSEVSRSSAEHFVAHQSIEPNRSHVSPMQRLAGEFLEPHREWVTKCAGSTHRQIPTITVITSGQTPISFLYQTYKLNSVTLATADIFGNQNFKGRTKINIWVFCQTQSTELL